MTCLKLVSNIPRFVDIFFFSNVLEVNTRQKWWKVTTPIKNNRKKKQKSFWCREEIIEFISAKASLFSIFTFKPN